ncbi:hypothetical protein ACFV4N_23865 [Actinosynnema sp. NPDC059797]
MPTDDPTPGQLWKARVLTVYDFEFEEEVDQIADLMDLRALLMAEVAELPSLTSTGSMRQTVTHPHLETIRQLTITIAKLTREAGIGSLDDQAPDSATARSDAGRALVSHRWNRGR